MSEHCIIIGASHAAAQLASSLRQEGWEGKISIVGDEPYMPTTARHYQKLSLLARKQKTSF